MKLLGKNIIDLGDRANPDRLGHISTYEKRNGNIYNVYFLEEAYFGFKEADQNGNVVSTGRSSDSYYYSLDIMFESKDRFLGWS
jgi:hypothetical protein|tara:strand:- start:5933 stop:6184 length:252 start_codon:yes stop_codon:yes gene_type:complete